MYQNTKWSKGLIKNSISTMMKYKNCLILKICKKKHREQDKVNYAVSEREDRVTDLTTLTRMTGCTGMYWAATGQEMG